MDSTNDTYNNILDAQEAPDVHAAKDEVVETEVEDVVEPEDPIQELRHRRAMTRSIIAAFAAASAALTTIPLPVKDAVMLSPIELAEINALASVYDIPQEESLYKIFDAIAELGIISMAARGAISVLEQTPKIIISSKVKSALIAAVIVGGIGISTAYLFEQVHLDKLSLDDLGLPRKIRESDAMQTVFKAVNGNLRKVVKDDALDGLKVSLAEMVKVLVPVA